MQLDLERPTHFPLLLLGQGFAESRPVVQATTAAAELLAWVVSVSAAELLSLLELELLEGLDADVSQLLCIWPPFTNWLAAYLLFAWAAFS